MLNDSPQDIDSFFSAQLNNLHVNYDEGQWQQLNVELTNITLKKRNWFIVKLTLTGFCIVVLSALFYYLNSGNNSFTKIKIYKLNTTDITKNKELVIDSVVVKTNKNSSANSIKLIQKTKNTLLDTSTIKNSSYIYW